MLDYKIINSKPTIVNNKVKYLDLLASNFRNKIPIKGFPIIVNRYYVARPDLISLAVYGTDEYADIICKVNDISNPFELNENDILLLPSLEYCETCVNTNSKSSELTNIENKTDDTLKNIYRKKLTEKRSPNEQTTGNTNYIIDKSSGLIFY